MNIEQKRLARHALGLPNDRQKSYRNRYLTASHGPTREVWEGMKTEGLACSGMQTSCGSFFHLTRAGAERALVEGESLDLEDFPPIGAH